MENSPLGKLSAELRNTISEMVLEYDYAVRIILSPGKGGVVCRQIASDTGESDEDTKYPCALAHTCKQARNECTKLYYARNEFFIDTTAISHEQFCTWFQGFTETAGPTLGHCSMLQSLDSLDDESMVSVLRETTLRLPDHSNHGLAQLSAVTFSCRYLGEQELFSIETEMPIRLIASTLQYLCLKVAHTYQQAPSTHSTQCMLRSVRMIHGLAKGAEGLICKKNPGLPEDVHEQFCKDMVDANADLLRVISRRQRIAEGLQVVDEPCSFQGCRPVKQRPTDSEAP